MAGTGPTNQLRTILGPLTTTYTPPLSCTVHVQAGGPTNNQAWQAQSCSGANENSDNPACWPPATVTAPSPVGTLATWGFYSPGLVCPIGMTTACYATGGGSSGWQVEFSLLPQETAVGCCPTSFSCSNFDAQTCIWVATSTTISVVTCQSGTSGNLEYVTVPATTSNVAVSEYILFAPLIQMNWQSTDRPSSSPTSTPTSSGTSGTLPTATSPPSSGLTPGAKAGIGVGVTLGALAVVALIFLYWKRRNARSRTDVQPVYELAGKKNGLHADSELQTGREFIELPAGEERRHVHEMHE
ncbi:hypothetical protein NA56DRAFT_93305 [Hyaloscypha hepaticicola]|uniref:Mid2 domain-containing protein n=1 Tax=Hyaloscypha hepaticicola TaxID=2082293 RepID=A0A2J6Q8P1_9HELO|nr:hypothetical protein NA56DRAFT_93305 [Hyaloscypha hepaticicola]